MENCSSILQTHSIRYFMLSKSPVIVLFFVMLCALGRYQVQSAGSRSRPFAFLRNLLSTSTSQYTRSSTLQVDISASSSSVYHGDVIVLPFFKPKSKNAEFVAELKANIPASVPAEYASIVSDILDENNFKADVNARRVVRLGNAGGVKYIALVGLGSSPEYSGASLGRSVLEISKDLKVSSVGIIAKPDSLQKKDVDDLLLGLHDAAYNDERFRKEPEGGHPSLTLKSVKLLGASNDIVNSVAAIQKQSVAVAAGVHFAKDLVGAPSNYKTPLEIANQARKIAADHNLEIKVLGETECKALGMGGYLGVQQGSAFPPQFIHMTYRDTSSSGNAEDTVKIALIGKGLTFDSGGYNLKVGATSMIEMMKIDMGGCAAVLGCAKVLGQLKPKNVEIHFISAVCENMISANAMRPGDVLVASNGKTIEVGNTDAEGRLTLADALVYAEKLQVDAIVDLATLTGACMVALGERVAGLYGSHSTLVEDLKASSQRTNDKLWQMPLEESYKENIKSSIADIKNTGAKGGGSITAALFLQEFVESTPWAHIDMAGPVWDTKKPTGFGVKLLVDFVLNAKKGSYKK